MPLAGIGLTEHAEHVKRAEAAGYTDVWSGETNGPDGFTPLALAASWTDQVRLGTGVEALTQEGGDRIPKTGVVTVDTTTGKLSARTSGCFQIRSRSNTPSR